MKCLSWLTAAAVIMSPAVGVAQSYATGGASDWSGAYVGGHLGYAFQDDDDDERLVFDTDLNGAYGDTVATSAGADAFSPGFCGGFAQGTTPGAGCEDDEDGVDVGLRAGYDYQFAGTNLSSGRSST
jgi:outer membrane immunogenic protein